MDNCEQKNGVQPRELEWDSEIQNDSTFQLLPEGDYNFEVVSFERARHNGSAKLPPCWKAVLTVRVWSEAGETTVKHNLFLHSSVEGMLCAFFTAIGQRSPGERIRMDWSRVPGSFGRCKLGVRKWTGDNGQTYESNQIVKFYEPDEHERAAFTAGQF